jgi:2,4-dienoyl-CoA reductase (NADPH2)
VVVIGAGPGGMQAAVSSVRRGHRVTVFERDTQPGGQARLAAIVPNRAEFGDIVRNLASECRREGVDIQFGVHADAATVLAERPDAVVVATGANPTRPYWVPQDDGDIRVCDVRDVLDGSAVPAGRVLVVDELGFHQATSVAELLADRECEVEIVTPGMVVGQDLGVTLDLENWNIRAAAKGIVQSTDLVGMGIEGGSVNLLHHPTGQNVTREVDWVVLAVPQAPNDGLYFELLAAGVEVHRVGDCVAPRRAHAAVIDGHRVGSAL